MSDVHTGLSYKSVSVKLAREPKQCKVDYEAKFVSTAAVCSGCENWIECEYNGKALNLQGSKLTLII